MAAAVGEAADRWTCPVCFELLHDPVRAPCGHVFCLLCLEKWYAAQPPPPLCPLDRGPLPLGIPEPDAVLAAEIRAHCGAATAAARAAEVAELREADCAADARDGASPSPRNAALVRRLRHGEGAEPRPLRCERVQRAMLLLPRADFYPPSFSERAYSPLLRPLQLPERCGGGTALAASLAAVMLEALEIAEGDNCLVIGSGSGHLVALCAVLAGPSGAAHGVDCSEAAVAYAAANLQQQRRALAGVAAATPCGFGGAWDWMKPGAVAVCSVGGRRVVLSVSAGAASGCAPCCLLWDDSTYSYAAARSTGGGELLLRETHPALAVQFQPLPVPAEWRLRPGAGGAGFEGERRALSGGPPLAVRGAAWRGGSDPLQTREAAEALQRAEVHDANCFDATEIGRVRAEHTPGGRGWDRVLCAAAVPSGLLSAVTALTAPGGAVVAAVAGWSGADAPAALVRLPTPGGSCSASAAGRGAAAPYAPGGGCPERPTAVILREVWLPELLPAPPEVPLREWPQEDPVSPAGLCSRFPRRRDPVEGSDGPLYSRQEFIMYYGRREGRRRWARAGAMAAEAEEAALRAAGGATREQLLSRCCGAVIGAPADGAVAAQLAEWGGGFEFEYCGDAAVCELRQPPAAGQAAFRSEALASALAVDVRCPCGRWLGEAFAAPPPRRDSGSAPAPAWRRHAALCEVLIDRRPAPAAAGSSRADEGALCALPPEMVVTCSGCGARLAAKRHIVCGDVVTAPAATAAERGGANSPQGNSPTASSPGASEPAGGAPDADGAGSPRAGALLDAAPGATRLPEVALVDVSPGACAELPASPLVCAACSAAVGLRLQEAELPAASASRRLPLRCVLWRGATAGLPQPHRTLAGVVALMSGAPAETAAAAAADGGGAPGDDLQRLMMSLMS